MPLLLLDNAVRPDMQFMSTLSHFLSEFYSLGTFSESL